MYAAVLDRLRLQVVGEPEAGGVVALDTLLLTERFGDVDGAVVADAEGDGVLDERLAGEAGTGEAGGDRDRGGWGLSKGYLTGTGLPSWRAIDSAAAMLARGMAIGTSKSVR